MNLDINLVNLILSESELDNIYRIEGWLHLNAFTSCDEDALSHLVANIGPIEGIEIGLRFLSLSTALKLRRLKTYYLFLPGLCSLDGGAARVLGQWLFRESPLCQITLQEPLSAYAATLLVSAPPEIGGSHGLLSISLPSITADVAKALMGHTDALYLEIRDGNLTPEIASALSRHAGYDLRLLLPTPVTDEVLLYLSGNADKRVGTQKGGVVVNVVDCDWWDSSHEDSPPVLDRAVLEQYLSQSGGGLPCCGSIVLDRFLARRLVRDRLIPTSRHAALDLKIFTDIDVEALSYLIGFEYGTIRLGIKELSQQVARCLSESTARVLSFPEHMDVLHGALLELKGFKGFVSFGLLNGLDQFSAEALAAMEGELSFSCQSLEVEAAHSLALHRGTLSIKVTNNLCTDALIQLMAHKGNELVLALEYKPDQQTLDAIRSNSAKRSFTIKGDIYPANNSVWAVSICQADHYQKALQYYRMTEVEAGLSLDGGVIGAQSDMLGG